MNRAQTIVVFAAFALAIFALTYFAILGARDGVMSWPAIVAALTAATLGMFGGAVYVASQANQEVLLMRKLSAAKRIALFELLRKP